MSWFRRKKTTDSTVWPELNVDAARESRASEPSGEAEREALPPELLAVVLGKKSDIDPLAAPSRLAALGWTALRGEFLPLLRGKRPYVAAVMTAALALCGDEAEQELTTCLSDLPPKSVLAVVCAFPRADAHPLARVLACLDDEDLDSAFARLAAGNLIEPVIAYLTSDDWRLVLRAATALTEAGCREAYPAIIAARDCSTDLTAAALAELLEEAEA